LLGIALVRQTPVEPPPRALLGIALVRCTPVRLTLAVLLAALLAAAPAAAKGPTPRAELQRLAAAGELDAARAQGYRDSYDAARKTLEQLTGFRRAQLRAVIANVDDAARRHQFTPTRLPALLLTLQRNRAWWSAAPLPYGGQRRTFPPSQVVWQFYPGQGWQIQWLATFGKANALWMVKTRDGDLRRLLDEVLSLAADRAGGIAFEYLFHFDGGRPPWVSGLAQGTGLSALSRGAVRLEDPRYFAAARSALGIFRTPPPAGVRRTLAAGAHYLQYSYAPGLRIANGFVQSLNGLHDFAALANDDEGRRLFAEGEAQLHEELPEFDTGAWSLYSRVGGVGRESDLGYHKVLRDFLRGLCERLTAAGSPSPDRYCNTARRFTADLTTKPKLALDLPEKPKRAKTKVNLRFTLDKVSTVTVTVARRGKVVLTSTARYGRGRHLVAIEPSRAGPLVVSAGAVDLAGNAASDHGTLHVTPPPKKHEAD
jgi:D-glucuronyl C5-epimerase C-terminus